MSSYRGRFAPTPSGPLHAGSVVAALASWLDARAHRGVWLVRIEDTDTPRCAAGADRHILQQLQALGLHPDEPVTWQSQRTAHYQAALSRLQACAQVYACTCSRSDIARELQARGVPKARHAVAVYPGTCRPAPSATGPDASPAEAAWRVAVPPGLTLKWQDRRLGEQVQDLGAEVGDFVVRRADGLWAYQLAVVVDDALQGISDVVRGEDLADNTPRQIHLQRSLGLPQPRYLHTPLVWATDGQKLSKQTGAAAVDTRHPLRTLADAAQVLGLDLPPPMVEPSDLPQTLQQWLQAAVERWGKRWRIGSAPPEAHR